MSSSVINTQDFPAARVLRAGLLVVLTALVLSACSGGGPETELNPVTTPPNQPTYSGPPPATADVQAFRINLWENIKATNRCGQCHTVGGQTPMFARPDDVNLAYDAANTVVNLTDPSQSRMVLKVGGGHNCWLSSAAACADILTTWITNWAGAAAGGGTQIKLLAPPLKDVSASRNFPDTPPAALCGSAQSADPVLLALPHLGRGDTAITLLRGCRHRRVLRGSEDEDQSGQSSTVAPGGASAR